MVGGRYKDTCRRHNLRRGIDQFRVVPANRKRSRAEAGRIDDDQVKARCAFAKAREPVKCVAVDEVVRIARQIVQTVIVQTPLEIRPRQVQIDDAPRLAECGAHAKRARIGEQVQYRPPGAVVAHPGAHFTHVEKQTHGQARSRPHHVVDAAFHDVDFIHTRSPGWLIRRQATQRWCGNTARVHLDVRRPHIGNVFAEDVAPAVERVARVDVDDRHIAEAVDRQAWRAFRVAMEQPVRAQICPRGELGPPTDRLSDKTRPGD